MIFCKAPGDRKDYLAMHKFGKRNSRAGGGNSIHHMHQVFIIDACQYTANFLIRH